MFGSKRKTGELAPVREFEPLARLRNEMESLFDRFLPSWWSEERWFRPAWEMEEGEKEFVVKAELPGFEPAEINLEMVENELHLTAEHKEEKAAKEKNGGTFRRHGRVDYRMTLPPDAAAEKLEAFYRNGVLEVHVPRKPEAQGRRIEVKT